MSSNCDCRPIMTECQQTSVGHINAALHLWISMQLLVLLLLSAFIWRKIA